MSEEPFVMPEPEEGRDYFIDEFRRYTVVIEVTVDELSETDEIDICSKAIDGFRRGELDGESEVVASDLLKKVESCEDGTPFDRMEWAQKKCAEMGLNIEGAPLKPHEKERPATEKTLLEIFTLG